MLYITYFAIHPHDYSENLYTWLRRSFIRNEGFTALKCIATLAKFYTPVKQVL